MIVLSHPSRLFLPLADRTAHIRFVALSFLLFSMVVSAQTPAYTPSMKFDVVSIRQTKSRENRVTPSGSFEPARSSHLNGNSWDIKTFLVWAYDVVDQRMIGFDHLPVDLKQAAFNIQAKGDSTTDERLAALSKDQSELEQMHMLQVVLAERFNLKAHWENRDTRTYDLVVSKPGKLKATGVLPSSGEVARWGNRDVPKLYEWGGSSQMELIAHGASTADLAQELSSRLGTLVHDKTGLTGKYDFHVPYATDQIAASDHGFDDANPSPALEVAIRDMLGLKLVLSRGPVPFLVIDHAEMPSEN
jgi:uncharacterized protein (TIGR03435 family)